MPTTQDDVLNLVQEFLERYSLAFCLVPGANAAEFAEAHGGTLSLSFKVPVKWGKWSMGRLQPMNCMVLNNECPPHEQAAVFLHELGHADYRDVTPRKLWNEVDSEL